MIVSNTTFPKQTFSSALDCVKVNVAKESAWLSVIVDSELIYYEQLTAIGGEVTLDELEELVKPYAKARLKVGMTVKVTDGTDTVELSTEVIYCSAIISTTAEDFCQKHFLTRLMESKTTAIGRLEYLHYIGTETATAKARYTDGTTKDFELQKVGGNERYTTIDCSPRLMAKEGKTLLAYVVTAGARSQEFRVDLHNPDCSPVLLFENSFGVDEIIYCTGTVKSSPAFKREQAYINGMFRSYDIKETRSIKGDTGILTFAEADWAQELFRSTYVRTLVFLNGNASVGHEVTLTDARAEYSNAATELPRFTFTYQPARRNHNYIDIRRPGRVFDDTFDKTFE